MSNSGKVLFVLFSQLFAVSCMFTPSHTKSQEERSLSDEKNSGTEGGASRTMKHIISLGFNCGVRYNLQSTYSRPEK